jgi:hypothetical protein
MIHYMQNVPGLKVNNAGSNSKGNSDSEMSYTYGSNSQQLQSYEYLQ